MKRLTLNLVLPFVCMVIVLPALTTNICFGQSQWLYEAFSGGKSGLIDIRGNWVVAPHFDSIDEVEHHRIYFFKDSLLGIANMNGKTLVRPRWKELIGDDYDLAIAVDEKGTTVVKVNNGKRICGYYKDVMFFYDDMLVVVDSNYKWGAIDQYGRQAVICRFDSLEHFEYGRARAWLAGRSFFIDKKGKEADAPDSYLNWRRSYVCHTFRSGGKWGAVNRKGDTVLSPVYDYLDYSAEGNACTFCKDGKCGVTDTLGRTIIAPKYDYLRSFRPQYASSPNVACLNGKWGLINGREQVMVPFVFEQLHSLDDNYFAASEDGKWGIINEKGEWVLTPGFERIRDRFFDADEPDQERYRYTRSGSFQDGYDYLAYRGGQEGINLAGDLAADVEIKVYPNPAKDRFAIQLPEGRPSAYRLYDSKGAVVLSGNLQDKITEANISSLAAAAYTLVVYHEGHAYDFRVTKQ